MRNHPLRTSLLALVLVYSTSLVLGGATPADALPTPSAPSTPAAPANGEATANPDQEERDGDFVGWLNESGFADRGFVVSVYNTADQSLTLRWKDLNEEDQAAVLQHAREMGVAVTFTQAKYSLQEIKAAQQEIAAQSKDLAAKGFELQRISGVAHADEGLLVTGTFKASATTSTSRSKIASTVQATSSIPITIQEAATGLATATRSNDVVTFNAGGYMRDASTGLVCSVGFGITINGTNRATTARHCDKTDYKARDNSNTDYGSTVTTSGDGAARVLSKGGSYWMFTGAWNNTSGSKKKVAGYRDVSLNDSVCTSGGNSGQHCDIIVNDMTVWRTDDYGGFDTIEGTRSAGIAVIQGDSGGPVFTSRSDGRVGAVGMIQTYNGIVTCPTNVHDRGTNICSNTVGFTSMRVIVNTISGAKLRTSS